MQDTEEERENRRVASAAYHFLMVVQFAPLGIALLERGFERDGEDIDLFDQGRAARARIVDACFFDPQGERMRG